MGIPPPPICCSPWPLRGFFTVSSTLSSKQVASEAAVIALAFTIAGSLKKERSTLETRTFPILPHTSCKVICNILIKNINSEPNTIPGVFLAEFIKNVGGIKSGIVA